MLSFSVCLKAQVRSTNFTQYTEKDGVPAVEIHDIVVDRLGYIWTGTLNGLARYDGYEFKRFYYNPNDTVSIHGLNVWSIFQDRKGEIWVATGPGFLNTYNPSTQKFRQFNFTDLVQRSATTEIGIRCMAEDDNGRMYFGVDTYYGDTVSSTILYKNENEDKLKVLPVPAGLRIHNTYRLIKDANGNIWALTYFGIFKIDTLGKLSRFQLLEDELRKNADYPGDIGFDKQGHMWVISQKLRLYDLNLETNTYKTWLSSELYPSNDFFFIPRSIDLDKDENIWIGTNGGLQFFNRKTEKFSHLDKGARIVVSDLSFDSFGTLWIGTAYDGLLKYEVRSLLKSYSYNKDDKNSLTSGWANNIYEASDGKIWITTGGSSATSGINILDTRNSQLRAIPYYKIQDRISGVYTIWENKPGEMYFAINNSTYKFSDKTLELKPVKLPGIPESIIINSFFKDSKKNEWLCTFSGLYKKDSGATAYKQYDLTRVNSRPAFSNEVTRVFESKRGIWILTNGGLFLYNHTTDKIERHGFDEEAGDIFITQDINSFYEDADGIAWVGTWQGGLSKYNVETKKIRTYTRNDGLPSMSIQGMLADERNNALWLSTFEGLSRFDIKTEQFNNFSIADGIQGQLFADGAMLKTSTGLFAFGGSNGITIFSPDDINKNSIPPKVFLTDLKLFNSSIVPGEKSILKKPVYETEKIVLAHNQNNISIEFLALHFSNPTQNKYSYKLENYDDDWRDVGNQQVAFYPNLPPGEYIFRVKAANDKGVWNEQGATLKIKINSPWWKTTLAYILYAVLALGLGFAIDRYLRRRLVQKERERNRTRELQQAKEIEKAYYKLEETHEALKATQSQLVQSEKMASLGELTAGIAHEIQNPLNFVNNFSEVNKELIAEMKDELDAANLNEARKIAENIKDNEEKIILHGKRADAIVKSMLQHSRSSSGKKEPTDINALCDEYLRLAFHGLRAKDKSFSAKFTTDLDSSIGKINVIPQDIGRVILNLINNAFYSVTEKKKLNVEGYEPAVTVSTVKNNGKVQITVKDNGTGIPQKALDKIFQPFFTTKPTGQGTGLGLSLSYDIITKGHGGDLKVETKDGEGSSFIISIPLNN
jgi:signal transduction histidine kinase/ligand-binding sensor domain-containing protein